MVKEGTPTWAKIFDEKNFSYVSPLRVDVMKTQGRWIRPGIENLGLKNVFWLENPYPIDFRGPPNFRKIFCTKGTTLLFFAILLKNRDLRVCV